MCNTEFVPTKCSIFKKHALEDFKVVTHKAYKPAVHIKNKEKDLKRTNEESFQDHFDIKKTKYEIVKFATSGLDSQKKEEAKVQLAIKLGAKPERNKYKNYKVLLQERRNQKEKQTSLSIHPPEKSRLNKLHKSNTGKNHVYKKGSDKGAILDVYGKLPKNEMLGKRKKLQKI